jgi:hypothetical protein
METRAVTSAIAYVPVQVEAGAAAGAAGTRATKAEGGAVAKAAGAGRAKGAASGKAASTSAGRPKPKAAAAARTRVVSSGPRQVAVPSKGYATTTASSKTTSSSSAKATGDYAFLQDKTLSAQEKLLLFLAIQKKNTNKELEAMLDKAAAQKEAAKKSGGGLFGGVTKLFDVAKSVVPALGLTDKLLGGKLDDLLKQVSGPMLGAAATALGMPALAPLAMSLGPKLVGAVMDAELPGATKTPATSSSSSSGSKGGELDEVELARVQMLQKRVEEWTALISNLMQSFHQARMNVVQNLR